MSVVIRESEQDRVVEVELTGKLTEADYEQFVPLTEQRIKSFDFSDVEAARQWIR